MLCGYVAEIERFKSEREKGKNIDTKKLAFACLMCCEYKALFLKAKEKLGFNDGLAFLEDNTYIFGNIVNGVFSGDRKKVLSIAEKWVNEFERTGNNYMYEAGIYVLMLSHPGIWNDELYKGYMPKNENLAA